MPTQQFKAHSPTALHHCKVTPLIKALRFVGFRPPQLTFINHYGIGTPTPCPAYKPTALATDTLNVSFRRPDDSWIWVPDDTNQDPNEPVFARTSVSELVGHANIEDLVGAKGFDGHGAGLQTNPNHDPNLKPDWEALYQEHKANGIKGWKAAAIRSALAAKLAPYALGGWRYLRLRQGTLIPDTQPDLPNPNPRDRVGGRIRKPGYARITPENPYADIVKRIGKPTEDPDMYFVPGRYRWGGGMTHFRGMGRMWWLTEVRGHTDHLTSGKTGHEVYLIANQYASFLRLYHQPQYRFPRLIHPVSYAALKDRFFLLAPLPFAAIEYCREQLGLEDWMPIQLHELDLGLQVEALMAAREGWLPEWWFDGGVVNLYNAVMKDVLTGASESMGKDATTRWMQPTTERRKRTTYDVHGRVTRDGLSSILMDTVGIPKVEAREFLSLFFDVVRRGLERDGEVELPGFGWLVYDGSKPSWRWRFRMSPRARRRLVLRFPDEGS